MAEASRQDPASVPASRCNARMSVLAVSGGRQEMAGTRQATPQSSREEDGGGSQNQDDRQDWAGASVGGVIVDAAAAASSSTT